METKGKTESARTKARVAFWADWSQNGRLNSPLSDAAKETLAFPLTKNAIAFQKGFALFPKSDDESARCGRALAATIQAELMNLGSMLDEEAFAALVETSRDVAVRFCDDVCDAQRRILGDGAFKPLYDGFPQQAMELSEVELFLNAIRHYASGGTWVPDAYAKSRPRLFENPNYRTITLGTEEDFGRILTDLLSIEQSLAPSDRKILLWFARERDRERLAELIPEKIPFKETLCLLVGELGIVPPGLTATDALRVIVHMSGGDVALSRKGDKIRKFSRADRKQLLAMLEFVGPRPEEMTRYRERWITIGEILHPGEFAKQFPKTFAAFDKLRNERIRTWAGRVEAERRLTEKLRLLRQRPGELARRLDALLRETDPERFSPDDAFLRRRRRELKERRNARFAEKFAEARRELAEGARRNFIDAALAGDESTIPKLFRFFQFARLTSEKERSAFLAAALAQEKIDAEARALWLERYRKAVARRDDFLERRVDPEGWRAKKEREAEERARSAQNVDANVAESAKTPEPTADVKDVKSDVEAESAPKRSPFGSRAFAMRIGPAPSAKPESAKTTGDSNARPTPKRPDVGFVTEKTPEEQVDEILSSFEAVASKVSSKVLGELYSHFEDRRFKGAPRFVTLKGERRSISLPPVPPFEEALVDRVQEIVLNAFKARFATLPPMGKCALDEKLRDLPLPTNMRSTSESAVPIARGVRMPIGVKVGETKVVRFYVHWKDETGCEDLDLSSTFIGKDRIDFISWNKAYARPYGCHSGDVRHRKGDCAEYVDVVLDEARKLFDYIVVDVRNFNGRSLKSVAPVCGFMEREFPESSLTWYPKTVANSFLITSERQSAILVAIDLQATEFVRLDLDGGDIPVASEDVAAITRALTQYMQPPKLSVYDLLTWHIDARGGEIVPWEERETAETVFNAADFATNYVETLKWLIVD